MNWDNEEGGGVAKVQRSILKVCTYGFNYLLCLLSYIGTNVFVFFYLEQEQRNLSVDIKRRGGLNMSFEFYIFFL